MKKLTVGILAHVDAGKTLHLRQYPQAGPGR